jgi:phosphoenolpyruvate carboxylase
MNYNTTYELDIDQELNDINVTIAEIDEMLGVDTDYEELSRLELIEECRRLKRELELVNEALYSHNAKQRLEAQIQQELKNGK